MKRSPLTRKTPLRAKTGLRRSAPMRNARRKSKPKAERDYHGWIASLPCLVSGEHGVQVHHVTASIHGGRFTRSHWLVVPLAPRFHQIQHGPHGSVEALGHRGFWLRYGIDLEAEARRLAEEWRARHGA